jgi:hypothetical protein
MDLKVIHDTIQFYLNKAQNEFISHGEIDLVLDRAQLAQFNDYYNNHKVYRPDNQVPVIGYGENQRINDALSPFKATYAFVNADTPGGIVSLPSNYMFLIALSTTQYVNSLGRNVTNPVSVLNEEEMIYRLESQVLPVTIDDPICIMNASNKIQLFPDVPQSGKVYYFRRPVAPNYVFSLSGRTETYNQAGSTQLEWREADVNNIISKALSYYGLNVSSQEIMQFAQVKINEGQ